VVVAYLGKYSGAGEHGKTGKTRHDLRIGMLEEELFRIAREVLAGSAGCIELVE
jgi:hypothetical protein